MPCSYLHSNSNLFSNSYLVLLLVAVVSLSATRAASATEPEAFCQGAAQAIEDHLRLGRSPTGEPRAWQVLAQLVRQWRLGRQDLYLDVSRYQQSSSQPSFLPVSRIFKAGLNLKTDPVVIHSANELRFIPFSQAGTDIVLVTGDGSILLDDGKARGVIAVAQRNHLRLHVLWSWNNLDIQAAAAQATRLARVSQLTSGQFLDLPPGQPFCNK